MLKSIFKRITIGILAVMLSLGNLATNNVDVKAASATVSYNTIGVCL